ncbi:MAG: hypothetical protein IIA61_01940 [Candidatus Marinimicrobia bacterium]|nr:hypothetical protein [Candidatus Neomarinimicrobiota bacterium]
MKPKQIKKQSDQAYFTVSIPKWSLYLLGAAILIIGIWIGISMEEREKVTQSSPVSSHIFTISTMDVAKQFDCSCGSCGEKNLAICTCPTAESTKQFIETNLSAGLGKEEVVNLVNKVYGHFNG